jgi:uncharacterized membrane protein YccC
MSAAGTVNPSVTPSVTVFHLQQAFKLALSLVLFYWLALWTNWDVPRYGGLAIVIISLGTTGASIEKGMMRFVGTTVGVAVGFLILGLFNYDRWATMLAFAAYITGIGYFMQASRYSYAWYVAAFVPLVVWADNYPNFDSAFYFGTFRYLETTAGILIYTVVDIVLWPRNAGEQLNQQGRNLWAEARELFANYRQQLMEGQLPAGSGDLRTRLAGTLSQMISTLQDAYSDTPTVSAQKRVWEVLRVNARALVDALELWRESIDDCRELDLDQLLPQLGPALATLDKRLDRIGALWQQRTASDAVPETGDGLLLESLTLDLDSSAYADLSHFQRAVVMSSVGQLKILDQASGELLRTMRVLAGLEPSRGLRVSSHGPDMFQPSRWDPGRLIHALFPPATFIAAFLFWVIMNPPTGPHVPMIAGILSLVVLRTPMNPLGLLAAFILSIFITVAPVYWLVMPGLGTGFGLLSLIFVYSFVFSYLGGRSPVLKTAPILMFVVMTGISNQQSYSFQGLVDGALMVLLSGTIMTVVYFAFSPMRPEQALLHSLRRFFHGCARITSGFAFERPSERAKGRRLRKRHFESMVLPAPAKIQMAQKYLDYKLYPDNTPEKVQRLLDSVQSIVYRLQSLEIAHNRIARHFSKIPETFVPLRSQIRELLQRLFERWASFELDGQFEQQRGSLQHLSRNLQQQFDALETGRDRDPISDQALTDLYTLLGTVRGLVEAMANAQDTINQINWRQWATTRF